MGSFLHLMGWRVGFGLLSAVREETFQVEKGWETREKSGFRPPVSKDTPLPPPFFPQLFCFLIRRKLRFRRCLPYYPSPPGGGGAGGAGGEGSTGVGKPQPEVR